jgi:HK97 family phage major capsid protein
MAKYLTPAQQEIRSLLNEADELSRRSEPSKQDTARSAYIYAKIKALSSGIDAVDYRTQFFSDLFKGKQPKPEVRATPLEAGQQTVLYSTGLEGGYLVPQEYHDEVQFGMAQYDPLLNKDIVTLLESKDQSLRPYTIPGWDMSTFAAVKVSENAQQIPQTTPPAASGVILGGYKYMSSLPVTNELEEDMYEVTQKLMADAFTVAFARGIGADLILGSGANAPQGVIAGTTSAYTLAALGVVSLTDIENIYFEVNRFHRASPKCAWLMNDAAYQMTRKAADTVGNPLLKIIKDKETLMGKPVYICPSLPLYNPSLGTQAAGSFCAFGDLSHMYVRVSRLSVSRSTQAAGYAENGKALYRGLMRADAKVFDPSSGATPPIVTAALHS